MGTPAREGWGEVEVVDREKCSVVGEGYPQETRVQAPNRLCHGGEGLGILQRVTGRS